MKKFKIIMFDLFFIVSGIIGVGFATGKEIAHFFVSGRSIIIGVVVFFLVFVGLCLYFLKIKNKYNIKSLTQLNKLAFGKYFEIGNIVLIILFIVTNSAMLAGCDNLIKNYLGLTLPIISLFLSAITFFIVLGGINRIKHLANYVMPILILIIIINACLNWGTKVDLEGNILINIAYPIIFCSENFITLISVLLNTKSNPKSLSIASGTIISLVVLFSAFAIGNNCADMPMLSMSKNLGNIFFSVYLIGVIFALLITLEISTYHCLTVINKAKRNKHFTLIVILLISQIIAYLGFNFIVKYLYTGIGVMGALYLITLIVRLMIVNKRIK